jgi:hypothetical protein
MNTYFKLLLIILAATPLLQTSPLAAMENLPQVEFKDQFDQPHRLDPEIQLIIYAHSKDSGSLMAEILTDVAPGHLHAMHAVYIANISGMPSLITRYIALPRLREIATPILLARETDKVAWIPATKDKITLLNVEQGQITSVRYSESEKELREILNIPPSND